MDVIRIAVSIFLFTLGIYFAFDLIINGFHLMVLLGMLGSFVGSYLIWPKNHKMESDWVDFVGNIIEIPFRLLSWVFRGIVKLARDTNDGVDL